MALRESAVNMEYIPKNIQEILLLSVVGIITQGSPYRSVIPRYITLVYHLLDR